ncbi:unnamed protein product [Closterium sp. NIES-64]|nr:unnamed protein product [Closterium sp. NIES-65]CAI6007159.1 unnamed protein product [Closterium sp. NIES-64]
MAANALRASHAAAGAVSFSEAAHTSSRRSAVPQLAPASFASFHGLKSVSSTTAPANPLRAILSARASIIPAASSRQTVSPVASAEIKVALLGAAGGIGQPLSLLLKMSPFVSELRLYDIANVAGVGADVSHCNTPAKVKAFSGPDQLGAALDSADLVIIPAGVPRKPGMTRDDLFNINAGIVKKLVEAAADHCPKAWINIITNPVNSTVPIAAEVLKSKGVWDPRKLFGVTTLDVVRANTFLAELKGLRMIDVDVPVIGGHAGATILPLLSKAKPSVTLTEDEAAKLTVRIQNAGTEVVEAKAGAGSATLSMAYAAARFAESCMRAMDGDPDVFECTYVASDVTELPFFASRVKLGREGLEAFLPSELEGLSPAEKAGLDAMVAELKGSIDKGTKFATQAPEPAAQPATK